MIRMTTMTKKNKPFVGITGTNAAGKGLIVEYLSSLGYTHLSLSDLLRELLRAENIEITRENLTRVGQEKRAVQGPGFLASAALTKIDTNKAYVLDSIRHPEEVRILQEGLPSFELWSIDADPALRFSRAQQRGRDESAQNLEAFLAQEQKEMTQNPNAQQLPQTMELASTHFMNNETPEALIDQVKNKLY